MDKKETRQQDYVTIDLKHIFRALWHRAWLILLAGILAGGVGFYTAAYTVVPMYSSSVLLYVNNSAVNLGNTSFNISTGDIEASMSLIKTYSVILKNRTTLERVIEKSGLPYSAGQLSGMIATGSANNTAIMQITVTGYDPYEAADIANCIAEVLPSRITEIIDGASVEVVDSAVPNMQKIAPSVVNRTATGLMIGMLLAAAVVALLAILDDTIHNEEFVMQNYDYPILAKIPNLWESGAGYRGKYYQKRYSRYYKRYYRKSNYKNYK